jgi:anaerobic magnesium-protoporphyrin IX monomethyl ester cyclase
LTLEAIIIADSGTVSLSSTNPLKLNIDGVTADIQVVQNYLANAGRIQYPIENDGQMSWASAPKLNGIHLFNFLTKHNHNVELINSFYKEKDRFRQLLKSNPRAVIISTTFITGKQNLYKLVADIRELAPNILIIAGGPLVYMSYLVLERSKKADYDAWSAKEDYLFLEVNNEPTVDLYIISTGGERLLSRVLNNTRKSIGLDDLPNCARLIDGAFHFSKRVDGSSSPEDYPIDWPAIPDANFKSGVVPLQASGGCSFNCAFCNFTKEHILTWVKPVDQIVAEMKAIAERGARYVWFLDDNFRLGKSDLEAVCRRFIDEGLNLHWMTFVRASTLDKVDPELLRLAGCIEVQLGLESADPQILKNMNKKASPALYDRVLKKLLRAGINCSCYFIFGFPGETEESAQRTRYFIKAYDYEMYDGNLSWSMFPFMLAPLSPIYEHGARKKYDLTGYMHKWKHATMNSDHAQEQVIKTFLDIKQSGPIYRGDNQNTIRQLEPVERRKFYATRHQLSKTALNGKLCKEKTLQSFKQVLQP